MRFIPREGGRSVEVRPWMIERQYACSGEPFDQWDAKNYRSPDGYMMHLPSGGSPLVCERCEESLYNDPVYFAFYTKHEFVIQENPWAS